MAGGEATPYKGTPERSLRYARRLYAPKRSPSMLKDVSATHAEDAFEFFHLRPHCIIVHATSVTQAPGSEAAQAASLCI